MKNIHILTTSKPSRLLNCIEGFRLFEEEVSPDNEWCVNVNIHITSDEEIKEGDPRINNYQRKLKGEEIPSKKIIMTTDQELQKEGVQAIDDEFLEWFIKNPSCESVEVISYLKDITNPLTNEKYPAVQHRYFDETKMIFRYHYKIIIPKEEQTKCYCGHTTYCDCGPKQETLEEVAERLYSDKEYPMYGEIRRDGFIKGARWQQEQYTVEEQHVGYNIDELDKEYIKGFNEGSAYQQERSYSEEEIIDLLLARDIELNSFEGIDKAKEWFEQFKKK